VWGWWHELWTGERLTYTEIRNWAEITGTPITGWEADLIKSIDRIFWKVQNE
jgi:hypothetical protein